MRLPKPLKIRCPAPYCRYEWLRPHGGILTAEGIIKRLYICPMCGEREEVVRQLGKTKLPTFVLTK